MQTIEKPRKKKVTPPPKGVPGTGSGHPDGSYYFASADLAPVIEAALPQFADENGDGALDRLAADVSHTLRMRQEGVTRRVYDIRTGRSRATGAELVGAICIATGYEINDLAVFPAGIASAREMVECHFEFNCDEEWDVVSRERLARMIWRFGIGYAAADDEVPTTEEFARSVARHRLRRYAAANKVPELGVRAKEEELVAA